MSYQIISYFIQHLGAGRYQLDKVTDKVKEPPFTWPPFAGPVDFERTQEKLGEFDNVKLLIEEKDRLDPDHKHVWMGP